MKETFKSNRLVIFSIIVMFILSLALISLGFFTPVITEGSIFSTTGTADASDVPDFTFTELSSGINLSGKYPMTYEVGMTTDPYSFSITNNETSSWIKYEVVMEVKSDNTLADELVSTNLGGVLTTGTSINATTTGYTKAYVIDTGYLKAIQSKTFNLKIWINESGTLENAQNKTWVGKIIVKAVKTIPAFIQTLESLNLASAVQEEPITYNMFDYTYNGYQNNTKIDGIGTTEGLYAMEDDFGTSYYFRGSKSLNNIVKFGKYDTDMYYYMIRKTDGNKAYSTGSLAECQAESSDANTYCTDSNKYASAGDDMYWRIVRINGDGTLRLMYIGTSATATGINSYAGRSLFNYDWNEPKYSGYTYDNSAPNVQDGTPSDIKNYLDTWYARSMSSEDANIATGQFYSDTTGYEYIVMAIYSPYKRLYKTGGYTTTVKPTLKTGITTETYGGIYNLKVGLLNIDEIVMSGYDGIYGSYGYDESGEQYPYTTNTDYWTTWTFSPARFNDGTNVFAVGSNGGVNDGDVNDRVTVRPVINLSAEYSQQLRGLGSTASPYTSVTDSF